MSAFAMARPVLFPTTFRLRFGALWALAMAVKSLMARSFSDSISMYRAFFAAIWVGAVLTLIGCRGPSDATNALDMSNKARLYELSELWSMAQIDLNHPPAKLQELAKYNRAGGFAYRAVADGELVVFWGVKLGEGQAIFAYEKNAPTAGGWVLLQDRTVKHLTAQEFQTTAKAGR